MRIAAISAQDADHRYRIKLPSIKAPLTAVYGLAGSGKTALADLIGHALFGKSPAAALKSTPLNGELVVEEGPRRYRIRRYQDEAGRSRLTVAALDGSPIDQQTIRRSVGNLPPAVLTPLCAVSFREPPAIARLLSQEFVRAFQHIGVEASHPATRRVAELAARRDLLAQELETRIATERRASKDLEVRWRELDRLVREEQHQAAAAEQRLKAVENSLAETDARLRYRRLELNVELRWQSNETPATERPADLDAQIARCRQTLAELNERESAVRARLAQTQSAQTNSTSVLADQQTWLAIFRQLAADLTGEVARLARASASQQCVCHDAHPRLRPIAETIERQLAVLEKSIQDQGQAVSAAELAIELDDLTRVQAELRRHLEHLLDRNQAHLRGSAMARQDASGLTTVFSAADADQLESRRLELEQERFRLAEQVNSAAKKLKVLRGERDALERERASLLSARSIEHVQRELAHVQKKLENAGRNSTLGDEAIADDFLQRASEFLAQLTNGDISGLMRVDQSHNAVVVNHNGATVSLDSLTTAQRDQVYLSLCLALLSAAARHGIWLPLVLDDPFERLDAGATAALAAVLEDFSRQGNQVLVFTQNKAAAERLASIGADTHEMINLRQPLSDAVSAVPVASQKRRNGADQHAKFKRRKKKPTSAPRNGESAEPGQSDAA